MDTSIDQLIQCYRQIIVQLEQLEQVFEQSIDSNLKISLKPTLPCAATYPLIVLPLQSEP